MKKLLGVLALAVLVIGGLTGCRNKKAEAAPRAAQVDAFEFGKADFLGFTKQMSSAVGEKGVDRLKKLAEGFPHTDSGIGYAARLGTRQDGDVIVYAPRVEYVWVGSGAHKAGIQPGDEVVSVNGVSLEIRCAKDAPDCLNEEAVQKLRDTISAAEKKESLFTVVRGATTKKAPPITPAPYGQDIRDHITANLDGYRKQLNGIAPKVAALEEKVNAATDLKTLEALVPEANALGQEISDVYQSVEAYIKTRVILAQPVAKARP